MFTGKNEQPDVLNNKKEHLINSSKLLYQVEEVISEIKSPTFTWQT